MIKPEQESAENRLTRTEQVIGEEGVARLKRSSVLIFGLGGVGSYAAEVLSRSGIGKITVVDGDTVSISNCNRQLPALFSTIGKRKAEVMAERMRDAAPDAFITAVSDFVSQENIDNFRFSEYNYVLDAVDDVQAKLLIIRRCYEANVPVISCMGTGNKKDPSRFRISDIGKTNVCPLARVMRRELKKAGVPCCRVVWSDEEPVKNGGIIGSLPFVPATAGMMMAGDVILTLSEGARP